MHWVNILHIYQPPWQTKKVVDKVVLESYQPILTILEKHPFLKITLNICGSLIEHLVNFGHISVLKQIRFLTEKGQIELLGSAKYHPIFPLLPQREVIRQIKLNEGVSQKYFGKCWLPRPKGFFLPELAYSEKVARVIEKLGYQYLILDEISYNGNIGKISFKNNWRIKGLNLRVVFRNRPISDLFFGKWLDREGKFWQALLKDGRSKKCLITAFDGENLGHHRKKRDALWSKIVQNKKVHTLTAFESFSLFSREKEVSPLAASWSSQKSHLEAGIPYALWKHPKNVLHQLQWHLTGIALKAIKIGQNSSHFKPARRLLDRALASDGYWWASIRPWWNPKIIKKTVDMFLDVFTLLKDVLPPEYLKRAEVIKSKIDKEIARRIQSGHYEITKEIGSTNLEIFKSKGRRKFH